MNKSLLDDIYLSVQGQIIPGLAVPCAENMFAPDSFCEKKYAEMREAYERLCTRLGVDLDDEDDDLNRMVDAMEKIQEVLCKKMFELGMVYAESCFASTE